MRKVKLGMYLGSTYMPFEATKFCESIPDDKTTFEIEEIILNRFAQVQKGDAWLLGTEDHLIGIRPWMFSILVPEITCEDVKDV